VVARVVYTAAGVGLIASQLAAEGVQVCLLAAAAVAGAVGAMECARLQLRVGEAVTQTLPLSACAALAWTSESSSTCVLLHGPDHLQG